jgi:hypothetical protein
MQWTPNHPGAASFGQGARAPARTLLVFALVSLVTMVSARTHADSPPPSELDASYRRHVEAALLAYEAGRLPEARAHFELAHLRFPNARTLRGLGTVQLEQQDFVPAAENLEAALTCTELPLSEALRGETELALRDANAHVGRVQVHAAPEAGSVRIDGRSVALGSVLVLVPGVHQLEISAAGYRTQSGPLNVLAGQYQLVRWQLEPAAAPEPVASQPLTSAAAAPQPASARDQPWLVLGAGSAVLLSGMVVLASGIHDYRAVRSPHDGESARDWAADRARYPRLLGAGGALVGVGALAAAAGLWWHMRGSGHDDVQLALGIDRLTVSGRF